MTKANFGWVARPPTLQLSKQLFSDVFRHSHKVRYSSPWVRALVFGANAHWDCTWATRLVGALAKRSYISPLSWSLLRGSPSAALHGWLLERGWRLLLPWLWKHDLSGATLDLRTPVAPLQKDRPGRPQHQVRVGWRAFCALRWLDSGRHEVRDLQLSWVGGHAFPEVDWEDVRQWASSAAPAVTVALGATFSPTTWRAVQGPPEHVSSSCIWPGCRQLGTWHHIGWECECPETVRGRLCKPDNPFIARLGWKIFNISKDYTGQVRRHLCRCQQLLWETAHATITEDS